MQAAKAVVSLRICAGSPEPSLLDNTISTKISGGGPNLYIIKVLQMAYIIIQRCQHSRYPNEEQILNPVKLKNFYDLANSVDPAC